MNIQMFLKVLAQRKSIYHIYYFLNTKIIFFLLFPTIILLAIIIFLLVKNSFIFAINSKKINLLFLMKKFLYYGISIYFLLFLMMNALKRKK